MSTDYKKKYIKYKLKFLQLKKLIGRGKEDKCTHCSSEWIYQSRKGQSLCEECWREQNAIVKEYHKIQESAKQDFIQGEKKSGIEKLKKVVELRNYLNDTYFADRDRSNDRQEMSHEMFAKIILPNLITELETTDINPMDLWHKHIDSLREEKK